MLEKMAEFFENRLSGYDEHMMKGIVRLQDDLIRISVTISIQFTAMQIIKFVNVVRWTSQMRIQAFI